MLLHGLKQGALHLSWGTVDFVREDEVREDRSLLHGEVLLLLAVHQGTHDVSRQEVWSELDTLVVSADELRERLDRQGLGQPWEPFEEDMPPREEADEQRVDQVALPHDRLMHTCTQGFNKVATALNLGGECADVYGFHMVLLRLSVYLKYAMRYASSTDVKSAVVPTPG